MCTIISLIIMGGALRPKLVWPEHGLGLPCFWCAVGVASNANLTKSWYGKGKVGVATATPTIRHSPPMLIMMMTFRSFRFRMVSTPLLSFLGNLAYTQVILARFEIVHGRTINRISCHYLPSPYASLHTCLFSYQC